MAKSQHERQLDEFVRKSETNNDGKPWGPKLRQELEAAKDAGDKKEIERITAMIRSIRD